MEDFDSECMVEWLVDVPSDTPCEVESETPVECELELPDMELVEPNPDTLLLSLYPAEMPLSRPPTRGMLPSTDLPRSTLTPKPELFDQPPPDELPLEDILPCESELIVPCAVPSETP